MNRLLPLIKLINQLLSDLKGLNKIYSNNLELKESKPFLRKWFASRSEIADSWLIPLTDNETVNNETDLKHLLNEITSIGQGFDIDLGWAGARGIKLEELAVDINDEASNILIEKFQ
tara:strand:- start:81 stop:431 length:351 start_codon:yes stop_codon:yes gene_type:complete